MHFRDDKTGEVYTDLMEIQILELKKLPPEGKEGEEILSWMRFFGGRSREEFEDMAKTNEYLDEAYQELIQLSADDKKRLEYEAREKALKDYNTQMSSSFERGVKKGQKIGEERGIKKGQKIGDELTKNIFKLHIEGRSPEEIADILKLPLEKISEILS